MKDLRLLIISLMLVGALSATNAQATQSCPPIQHELVHSASYVTIDLGADSLNALIVVLEVVPLRALLLIEGGVYEIGDIDTYGFAQNVIGAFYVETMYTLTQDGSMGFEYGNIFNLNNEEMYPLEPQVCVDIASPAVPNGVNCIEGELDTTLPWSHVCWAEYKDDFLPDTYDDISTDNPDTSETPYVLENGTVGSATAKPNGYLTDANGDALTTENTVPEIACCVVYGDPQITE